MYPSERTPLASVQPGPPYVFMANSNREYRKQIRQFQCCVCTTILAIFMSALIVTIIYSVDNDDEDIVPTPTPNNITTPHPPPAPNNSIPSNSSLQTLMQLSFPLKDDIPPGWSGPFPDNNALLTAISKGKESNLKKIELEKKMPLMLKSSPTFRYRLAQKTSKEASNLAEYGHVMEEATRQLNSIPGKTVGRGPKVAFNLLDNPACAEKVEDACEVSRYRSIDGSCNNLKNGSWGAAMIPFRRALPPVYADGISVPRSSSDNTPLPSAREVSVTIHRPEYRDDPHFTVMLAVWGQFLDHDLTATALSQGQNGEPITCCAKSSEAAHPECMPVRISPEDPMNKDSNVECLDFVRSAPAPSCTLGPREQLNQATSFLDGSVVYGSDDKLAKQLRSFQGGKLLVSRAEDGKALLPVSTDSSDGCNEEEENKKGRYCFMAGDGRANENLHLTTMHLLFVRQHNLIAEKLSEMNPDWSDEEIYQEARHIVAAQMQHITYHEFLPVVLGPTLVNHLKLRPQHSGYSDKYEETVDPTIANNFAASSFRFAHTLLPGLMKIASQRAGSYESIELHKMLFNPYKLYAKGFLDKTIQGALNTSLERADPYFSPEVTQLLFVREGENNATKSMKNPPCGLDLVSLNVQRGRDHGLPTYPTWREHCGLKRPHSFEDLRGNVDEESLKRMSAIYKSVDDVDLYTGSLSEVPIEGGLLGPTITCLLADQFKRLKTGDHYWYETSEEPQKFTLEQLNEIRKTTLAGIICDSSDDVKESQRRVMQSISPSNERISCSKIPKTNLGAWKVPNRERVDLTAVSGIIKTDVHEIVWEGALPSAIPLPSFLGQKEFIETSDNSSVKVMNGVQWLTNSIEVDGGFVHCNGTFSAPDYENPFDDANALGWVNGKFNVKFQAEGNVDLHRFQGQVISSPIYFRATHNELSDSSVPQKFVLQNSSPNVRKKFVLQDSSASAGKEFVLDDSSTGPGKKFVLQAPRQKFTLEKMPTVSRQKFILEQKLSVKIADQVKAPLFLDGSFNQDRTDFLWNGKGFALFPTAKSPEIVPNHQTGTMNNQPVKRETELDSAENDSQFDEDWVIVPKSNPSRMIGSDGSGSLTANPKSEWMDISGFVESFVISDGVKSQLSKKKKTLQKSQLRASDNSNDPKFQKFESIPGHWMNVSEEDSEWELVPGTKADYRRKNSKDPRHLGPKDPPGNKNVVDEIIEERQKGQAHPRDPVKAGSAPTDPPITQEIIDEIIEARKKGKKHPRDPLQSGPSILVPKSKAKKTFVEFKLKALLDDEAKSKLTEGEAQENRVLIKVDPSLSLFPAAWKYDKKTKNRVIPVDYFYKVTSTARSSKPIILWKAHLNPATNLMSGNISIPEYVLDAKNAKHVAWQNTSFSLNFQSAAASALQLFTKSESLHNSRIILKDQKCSKVENVSNDFQTLNWQLDTFQKISLIQAGSSLPTSDIHLLGEFTENKTAFLWGGGLIVDFSRVKQDDFETALKDISSSWSTVPLKVTSVAVNLDSINGKPPPKGWSSLTPNSFPLSILSKNHITDVNSALLWTGHVEGDKLKGNFTLPLFQDLSKTVPHVLKGHFELQLRANLPQVSWSNPKPIYTAESDDPKNPLIVPFLDIWPPPPSFYPRAFPIPFPLNISASPSDPAVKTKPVTPASLHLLQNTIPWPPSYPKWPANAGVPAPWDHPYPFADSNAERHPDEYKLADEWREYGKKAERIMAEQEKTKAQGKPNAEKYPNEKWPAHELHEHKELADEKRPSHELHEHRELADEKRPAHELHEYRKLADEKRPAHELHEHRELADEKRPAHELHEHRELADEKRKSQRTVNAQKHPDTNLPDGWQLPEKGAVGMKNSQGTQTDARNFGTNAVETPDLKTKSKSKIIHSGLKIENKKIQTNGIPLGPLTAKASNSVKRATKSDIERLTAIYMKKLATVVKPGVQYSTKLVVNSKDGVKYDTTLLNLNQSFTNMLKNSVPSKVVIDGEWKGNGSYYWPGNAVFLLAPPQLKPQLKKFGSPIGTLPFYKGKYAAKIVDGDVSAGVQLTGPSTIWSGKMPATIPLPVSWAAANISEGSSVVKGIHWVPTVVSYDRVEGNYYLDDTSNSSSSYSGNFRFVLMPVWSDTTINKLLIPGRKYYSKINLEKIPDWMKYATAGSLMEDPPADGDVEKQAPLTIKGDYNEDNTSFEWTGNAVITIT